MSELRRHAAAATVFAGIAVLWTFPLVRRLSTHLPGGDYGDNVTFLWNFWWMRQALAGSLEFFWTGMLFAPVGTDLTLHTHSALPAFIGATALRPFSPLEALNVTILASVFLAGFWTYVLASRLTNDKAAAVAAGVIFATSPFLAARLHGHFNLMHAWVFPLFALTLYEWAARRTLASAVLAGTILGLTAYVDYYFFVFAVGLSLLLLAFHGRRWMVVRQPRRSLGRVERAVAILLVCDVLVLGALAVTGGFAASVLGIRVSVRNWFNPLQAFWLLAGAWLWLKYRPYITRLVDADVPTQQQRLVLWPFALSCVLVIAPLVWNAIELVLAGEYVTQRHLWRSGPSGIDASTLLLGNPFHGLWGEPISRFLESRGIDVMESAGWIGVAPTLLSIYALVRLRREPSVRLWAAVGGAFLLWSLGPHLTVFGVNTGMILPQAVLRYLPVLSNARIPGRAMVVVFLAAAVLSALALAELRRRSPRRGWLLGGILAAMLIDNMAAPVPFVPISAPAIYQTLRDQPESGVTLELPIGIRDGFGVHGHLDHRVLFYQTVHERPVTGGFVARLSPTVKARYENDPLFAALLELSEGDAGREGTPLPDRSAASAALEADGIRFVVLNEQTAPPALLRYARGVMPLAEIRRDAERVLYRVIR